MIEAAKNDPYLALKPRRTQMVRKISMTTWEEHFTNILNQEGTTSAYALKPTETDKPYIRPFSKNEVEDTIKRLKNNKAAGPDGIFNEHLKGSLDILLPEITDLMNLCLKLGNIPTGWRGSIVKVLYKGKGDPSDPNLYRGIALENNFLKILTKLIASRLNREATLKIPEEQFGFRTGRNTLQAVQNLIGDIEDALRPTSGKFHAVFIDYAKAFDTLDRTILSTKLESIIEENKELVTLIHNILRVNTVKISDNITMSKEIIQTNGVLQGDPLSPLLFNIATYDVVQRLRQEAETVRIYIYADDMVIGTHSRTELQRAIDALKLWAKENKLKINTSKTVQMIFRKGGRIATDDRVTMDGAPLQIVHSFKYLGVTLQTTMKSFKLHTKSRAAAATKAIYDIKSLNRLSLQSAVKLFKAKIVPILTYGIELTWEKLTTNDLRTIEAVKSRFLKAVLGVSKYTKSRLVYELAKESFLLEDLRLEHNLPSTSCYTRVLLERVEKRKEIWIDFYSTEAMVDRSWTEANQDLRHFVNSLATHGYHHKICSTKTYHQPDENCVCELCYQPCDRYHITQCRKRDIPIIKLCKN